MPADCRVVARVREKDILTLGSPLRTLFASALVVFAIAVIGCSKPKVESVGSKDHASGDGEIGSPLQVSSPPERLKILYPSDGALFPPDIVAPTFRWQDVNPASQAWLIEFRFQDGPGMDFESRSTEWTVPDESWETIKQRSLESAVGVTIRAVSHSDPDTTISAAGVSIGTSRDAVDAPLFFREVNLPFLTAVKDPARYIRWRFGTISSKEPPPIVLEQLPVCGNCHSFSADGSTLAMEVDSGNDKGSYAIAPIEKQIVLDDSKVMTWNDYRREDGKPTFGLLCQVSPDGRYVVGTVQDRALAVYRPNLMFSQLFFLVKGILAIHDRQTKTIRSLPGADDRKFVQTNATWSPDGKTLVFARSEAYDPPGVDQIRTVLLPPESATEFVEGKRTFLYDLYRVPFNDGKGGKAEPIEGASNNGMSNYFPKFSPDGKWIVFCKAKSFMLLQPDSELYIIPAEGGQARRLECNTSRMNSWHSWSPNGKWLVFSSKEYSAYTQLFLTHIDGQGHSSVPVVLSRFTAPERAANIPEFANVEPDAIEKISADFLDDHSYFRAAKEYMKQDDLEGANPLLRESLRINPKNVASRVQLAVNLINLGKAEEAGPHFRKIIELQPSHAGAHYHLAGILYQEKKLTEAAEQYRQALRANPELHEACLNLGLILLETGDTNAAVESLVEAVRLEPRSAMGNYYCGIAFHRQGKPEEAVAYYERSVEYNPELLPALLGIASIRIMADRPELFDIDKALASATKACEVTGHKHPEALRILAAVYAVAGRFDDAVNTASKAIQIARAGGAPDLANRIETMLDAYKKLQAGKQK